MSLELGIETLLANHPDWLWGRRVGLVAHPASVDARGVPSVERLLKAGVKLIALFGPEHGFAGTGGAGEKIPSGRDPASGLPVYSLYGETRKPTPEMMRDLDVLIFDLQDLGARPYTYVSTLRYLLEAAAESGKTLIVADRPIPLPRVVDGPMLDPAFESFVGAIRAPLAYGMTPGETARFLQNDLGLDLELRVAPLRGFRRDRSDLSDASDQAGSWIPPSPAIRSWASAACFPATVLFEALPALDHGRGTDLAFQVVGAPWLNSPCLREILAARPLPGARVEALTYSAAKGLHAGMRVKGLRLVITDPASFEPVRIGLTLLSEIQYRHGIASCWQAPGTRPDFFDQLMGTDTVRRALLEGVVPESIAAEWRQSRVAFMNHRRSALLYS